MGTKCYCSVLVTSNARSAPYAGSRPIAPFGSRCPRKALENVLSLLNTLLIMMSSGSESRMGFITESSQHWGRRSNFQPAGRTTETKTGHRTSRFAAPSVGRALGRAAAPAFATKKSSQNPARPPIRSSVNTESPHADAPAPQPAAVGVWKNSPEHVVCGAHDV